MKTRINPFLIEHLESKINSLQSIIKNIDEQNCSDEMKKILKEGVEKDINSLYEELDGVKVINTGG